MRKAIGVISIIIGCLMIIHNFFLGGPDFIFQQTYKLLELSMGGLFIVSGVSCLGDYRIKELLSQIYELNSKIEQLSNKPDIKTANTRPASNTYAKTSNAPINPNSLNIVTRESSDNPKVPRRDGESDKAYWARVERTIQSDDFRPWN